MGLHCLNAAGYSSGVKMLLRHGLSIEVEEWIPTEVSEVSEEGDHAVLTVFTAQRSPRVRTLYGALDTETCAASLIAIE